MHTSAKTFELAENLVIAAMGLALSVCIWQHELDLGSFLILWLTYDAMLVETMRRHRWSDLALSVCFVLLLAPLAVGWFACPSIH